MRAALLFPLLAAALYWPLLQQDWYGDDWIWLEGARAARTPLDLFHPHVFDFVRPTTNLFWWIAGRLGGLDAAPAVAMVVLLHAGTAAGVLAWLRPRVQVPTALGAALLFLVSLSCRGAVTWPSAVGDLLVGLGTVWTLVALDRRPRLVPLLTLATVMAKESAVVLPLILIAADPARKRLHAVTLVLTAAFYAWELQFVGSHGLGHLDFGVAERWAELVGDSAVTLPLGVLGAAIPVALALALRTRAALFCLLWLALAAAPYAYYRRDMLYPRYLYPPTVAGVCLLALAADRRPRPLVGTAWAAAVLWHLMAASLSPSAIRHELAVPSLISGAEGAERLYVWQRADYAPWASAMASVVTGLPRERVLELNRAAFDRPRPGDRLLGFDEAAGSFYDFRPAWEALDARFELLPGTRPIEREGDRVVQWQTLAEWDFRNPTPWRRVRLEESGTEDGYPVLQATGYSSYLALDAVQSPLHVQAVCVETRAPGETLLLTWDRESDAEPRHARAVTSGTAWLIPVGHPDWWNGGALKTLRVHPRATAGPVVVERISLIGLPYRERVSERRDSGQSMLWRSFP